MWPECLQFQGFYSAIIHPKLCGFFFFFSVVTSILLGTRSDLKRYFVVCEFLLLFFISSSFHFCVAVKGSLAAVFLWVDTVCLVTRVKMSMFCLAEVSLQWSTHVHTCAGLWWLASATALLEVKPLVLWIMMLLGTECRLEIRLFTTFCPSCHKLLPKIFGLIYCCTVVTLRGSAFNPGLTALAQNKGGGVDTCILHVKGLWKAVLFCL